MKAKCFDEKIDKPAPFPGAGPVLYADVLPTKVQKSKGVQNRHENGAEDIADRIKHNTFLLFLLFTFVNFNISRVPRFFNLCYTVKKQGRRGRYGL
jgi:hypothetical protein